MKLSSLSQMRVSNLFEDEDKYVAGKIDAVKQSKDKSQNELADDADISKATASNIRHGRKNPSINTLKKLAKSGVKLDPMKL